MAKRTINYQRAITVLNKIFKAANEEYFNNELPTPTITIQSTVTAYGYISVDKVWQTDEGNTSYELNVSADYLNRPIEQLTATMLHETAHLYNLEHGIKDTSNGYYHNKRFKKTAEEFCHLQIDCDTKYGWTVTSPTEETLDFVIRNGFEDFLIHRETPFAFKGIGGTSGNTGAAGTPKTKPKGSNSIKWICPKCGAIVRSTREVNILCGDCNEPFIKA